MWKALPRKPDYRRYIQALKKPAFGQISSDFSKDFDITLVTPRKLTNAETDQLKKLYKAKFGHDLGICDVHDKAQLDYIPVYGKIDLNLK